MRFYAYITTIVISLCTIPLIKSMDGISDWEEEPIEAVEPPTQLAQNQSIPFYLFYYPYEKRHESAVAVLLTNQLEQHPDCLWAVNGLEETPLMLAVNSSRWLTQIIVTHLKQRYKNHPGRLQEYVHHKDQHGHTAMFRFGLLHQDKPEKTKDGQRIIQALIQLGADIAEFEQGKNYQPKPTRWQETERTDPIFSDDPNVVQEILTKNPERIWAIHKMFRTTLLQQALTSNRFTVAQVVLNHVATLSDDDQRLFVNHAERTPHAATLLTSHICVCQGANPLTHALFTQMLHLGLDLDAKYHRHCPTIREDINQRRFNESLMQLIEPSAYNSRDCSNNIDKQEDKAVEQTTETVQQSNDLPSTELLIDTDDSQKTTRQEEDKVVEINIKIVQPQFKSQPPCTGNLGANHDCSEIDDPQKDETTTTEQEQQSEQQSQASSTEGKQKSTFSFSHSPSVTYIMGAAGLSVIAYAAYHYFFVQTEVDNERNIEDQSESE